MNSAHGSDGRCRGRRGGEDTGVAGTGLPVGGSTPLDQDGEEWRR
jgi:hypothetical protein